jgi:hypothetical protein
MFKRLFSITFLSVVFLFSCKKDSLIDSAPVIKEPSSLFILQNDIYPNPCQGTFTIKTNTTDSQNVNLYDLRGVELLNLKINGTTAIVNNSLVNGIYFLRISSKYGTNTNKISVAK